MAVQRLAMVVGPQTGSVGVQAVDQFSSAQLVMNLRTGPTITFGLPGRSAAALQTSGLTTDVWVYKNGQSVPFRRLRVLPVDQEWGESAEDDTVINAVGYQRLVEARFIVSGPPSFTGVDQGAILKALVDHTQAQTGGSLGITFGTYLNGTLRDRNEYKIGNNLGQLMSALGDVAGGAWWGIDALKVFTSKLFSAFPVRTDPIAIGVNAIHLKRSPGKTFANAAGASGSDTQTVPVWVTTAGIATDPRGRWEAFDSSHSDVIIQATVAEYAAGNLAERQYPPAIWTITLDPAAYFEGSSNYAEGEVVPVVIPPTAVDEIGSPALSHTVMITEVSISFDDSGAMAVVLAALEVS